MSTTTVHIPHSLLEAVDARATAEGVSRNRFIILALERFLEEQDSWPQGFIAELRRRPRPDDVAAIQQMTGAILERRSSKRPPRL